ncbi:hypothetical protein PAPYR_7237 [Paratrimastix pyriformis]|uniref:Uncharacterized protein n=1 Tax=Paratrimastix pyriformis TaxID=342808 RepID=A0ABQ8UDI9_9EUKA|nr:hypothetical protein PAPYR_7237 [Paratrimastix pyriformis]
MEGKISSLVPRPFHLALVWLALYETLWITLELLAISSISAALKNYLKMLLYGNLWAIFCGVFMVLIWYTMSSIQWVDFNLLQQPEPPVTFFSSLALTIQHSWNVFLVTFSPMVMVCTLYDVSKIKGLIAAFFVASLTLPYCIHITMYALGFNWWYYRLTVIGYTFAMVMCVGISVILRRALKLPKTFIAAFLMEFISIAMVFLLISFIVVNFFGMLRTDWARLIFRIVAYPVIIEIALLCARLSAYLYPNVTYPSNLHNINYIVQLSTQICGRFLLVAFADQELAILGTIVTVVVESFTRLTQRFRDRFIVWLFTCGKKNNFWSKAYAEELKRDSQVARFTAENGSVLATPFLQLFFYKQRAFFMLNFAPGDPAPDTWDLLSSALLRWVIERHLMVYTVPKEGGGGEGQGGKSPLVVAAQELQLPASPSPILAARQRASATRIRRQLSTKLDAPALLGPSPSPDSPADTVLEAPVAPGTPIPAKAALEAAASPAESPPDVRQAVTETDLPASAKSAATVLRTDPTTPPGGLDSAPRQNPSEPVLTLLTSFTARDHQADPAELPLQEVESPAAATTPTILLSASTLRASDSWEAPAASPGAGPAGFSSVTSEAAAAPAPALAPALAPPPECSPGPGSSPAPPSISESDPPSPAPGKGGRPRSQCDRLCRRFWIYLLPKLWLTLVAACYFPMLYTFWPELSICTDTTNLCSCSFRLRSLYCAASNFTVDALQPVPFGPLPGR